MLAKELLNIDFTPLSPSSPVSAALAKMDAWQSSSIPVVEPATRKNAGHILFEDIAEVTDEATPVSEVELRKPVYTFENQHIFEVARLMLQHEVRLLSVVDNSETYLGIIEKKKVLEALSKMLNIANEGSVITIEMSESDFTLAELVHLVEVEGVKILGLTVEHVAKNEKSMIQISLKLNQQDASAVTSSLRRHGYTTTTENKQDLFQMDISSRADELMRYLDV
ncbi:MAG: CBS domain-containing protein [Balneolaceae bacterium]